MIKKIIKLSEKLTKLRKEKNKAKKGIPNHVYLVNLKNLEEKLIEIENETIKLVHDYIIVKINEIQPGVAYNIYACGCVMGHDTDPQSIAYFPKTKQKNRTCSIHIPMALVQKYKQCSCGKEFLSSNIQTSKSCVECYSQKKKLAKQITKKVKIKHFKVYHGYDEDRIYCLHTKRCTDWAAEEDLQWRPCKDCPDYTLKQGEHSPLDRLHEGE